jgi:hypothetical protein
MLPKLINDEVKLWPPAKCCYCGRLTIRAAGVPGMVIPCCWECDLELAIWNHAKVFLAG